MREISPPKRSADTLKRRRVQLDWPEDRDLRILSLDGGGIRGIFTAAYLCGLEQRHLGGCSIAGYFDLICGTSTGGILALALASGFTAAELLDLYVKRGNEIFPPVTENWFGEIESRVRSARSLMYYRYERDALERILKQYLGSRKFGEASTRLCIPAFEGHHGEVFVYKTPHHPDFKKDLHEDMVTVGLATAAAPTYFRPLEKDGYVMVDGGVWANNPIMIGLVDALSCYNVRRENIRILSIGCGSDPYHVRESMRKFGGLWHWRKIMTAAMRLQSQNAIGQACLLIGADRVYRIDRSSDAPLIKLDDWLAACSTLPAEANATIEKTESDLAQFFLSSKAAIYRPHYAHSPVD